MYKGLDHHEKKRGGVPDNFKKDLRRKKLSSQFCMCVCAYSKNRFLVPIPGLDKY